MDILLSHVQFPRDPAWFSSSLLLEVCLLLSLIAPQPFRGWCDWLWSRSPRKVRRYWVSDMHHDGQHLCLTCLSTPITLALVLFSQCLLVVRSQSRFLHRCVWRCWSTEEGMQSYLDAHSGRSCQKVDCIFEHRSHTSGCCLSRKLAVLAWPFSPSYPWTHLKP